MQQPYIVLWYDCLLVLQNLEPSLKSSRRGTARMGGSANYQPINPLGLYVVVASIPDLPATFPYYCPMTVLEWNTGHVFGMTSFSE